MCHERRPYLRSKYTDKTPEDDGAAAELWGDGEPEVAAGGEAGRGGAVEVGYLDGWAMVEVGLLEEVELAAEGSGEASEPGEGEGCEDG